MRFLLSSSSQNTKYSKNSTTITSNNHKRPISFQSIDPLEQSDSSVKPKHKKNPRQKKMKPKRENKNDIPITRKSEESKEVNACFLCEWVFPHSFRGEEKNAHVDRCMGMLGEEDKKYLTKCDGDLKKYLFGFEEHMNEKTGKTHRGNKHRDSSHSKEKREISLDFYEIETKKIRKKKKDFIKKEEGEEDDDERIIEKDKKKKKAGKAQEFSIKIEEDEPQVKKKVKVQEILEINGQSDKKDYTRVLLLPLVRELVFDPSKEFKRGPRKAKRENS